MLCVNRERGGLSSREDFWHNTIPMERRALRAPREPPECLSPGREHIPTEDFKDAPAIVPGQLAKHHYQSITTSKKGKNQGGK